MSGMTKVQAIAKVMADNGGVANLEMIYGNIEKYYPAIHASAKWKEGIRGVLYREIRNKKAFKKIGLSIYALTDYAEEAQPDKKDTVKMHSFIEGICVELGNYNGFDTFSADPSAVYRDKMLIKDFTSLPTIPQFSYNEILREAQRIDVVWFNRVGLAFPQKVFEVVDSVGTLNGAFNRSLQLSNFRTHFFIVAPEKHRDKFNQTINLEVYRASKNRFTFLTYDYVLELYDNTARTKRLKAQIFG